MFLYYFLGGAKRVVPPKVLNHRWSQRVLFCCFKLEIYIFLCNPVIFYIISFPSYYWHNKTKKRERKHCYGSQMLFWSKNYAAEESGACTRNTSYNSELKFEQMFANQAFLHLFLVSKVCQMEFLKMWTLVKLYQGFVRFFFTLHAILKGNITGGGGVE